MMTNDKLCTLKVLFEDNQKNGGKVYRGPSQSRLVERRKYWAFDTSYTGNPWDWQGLWLIDKVTEWVWSIAAYGQKNRPIMSLDQLIKHYQADQEVVS